MYLHPILQGEFDFKDLDGNAEDLPGEPCTGGGGQGALSTPLPYLTLNLTLIVSIVPLSHYGKYFLQILTKCNVWREE